MLVLYLTFCTGIPPFFTTMLTIATPVLLEGMFKRTIWKQLIDTRHGLRHPRLYAAADVLLSITSAYTGPVKTVVRLVGSQLWYVDSVSLVLLCPLAL